MSEPVHYDPAFAAHGETAIAAYARVIGDDNGESPDKMIVGCIASLLHYAEANCYDPGNIAERALTLFKLEAGL